MTEAIMTMLTEDMKRAVSVHLGMVASVCPDGTPNLATNPAIEINVVDPLIRKGYRFKGTAEVFTNGTFFERGIHFYEERGTVKARERILAIVLVNVERAEPVVSPAYNLGATEAELKEQWLAKLTANGD